MAKLRILDGSTLCFEWAVRALPRPQVRLALRPLLPVPVLRLADDSGFAQGLNLLRRILPLVFRRRPEAGRQRTHILEDQIPVGHVGARLLKSRALFAVPPQTLTWLQSSCPGELAPDKADVAGMVTLQDAEPLVYALHGEQLLRKPIDHGVMHAIQLVLEEADFKLTRPAVVSGFVGHLDADRPVAAQFHRVEINFDPVALEFLRRHLELPTLLVVVPNLQIVPGRLLAPAGFADDPLQDLTRRKLVQVDRGLHHPFEPGVAVLDHFFVGGVAVRRLVFDDVHARSLRIAHYQIQLQRQVDVGDMVTHAGSDEDPGSLGEVDDVQFHGAAGAEPPGANNVDLVGRRLTGHAEVALAVATTRDTRLPRVEQLRRGFAGPDPCGSGVIRLAGLLGQHRPVNQRENLHIELLSQSLTLPSQSRS